MDNNVTFVYVNYYSLDHIVKSIKSVRDNTYGDINTIIVSNSKIDVNDKNKLGNDVKLIELDDNYGYSYAINVASTYINTEYFWVMNPDTLIKSNVVSELKDCIDNNVAIIGPRIVDENNSQDNNLKHDIDKKYFLYEALPFLRFFFKSLNFDDYKLEYSSPVSSINGCSMLFKTDLFRDIGGMDSNYFLYWEENDICLRARKKGYKVFYCHQPIVQHEGRLTTDKKFIGNVIEQHISKKYFIKKHYPSYIGINRISSIMLYIQLFLFSVLRMNYVKIRQYYYVLKYYLTQY